MFLLQVITILAKYYMKCMYFKCVCGLGDEIKISECWMWQSHWCFCYKLKHSPFLVNFVSPVKYLCKQRFMLQSLIALYTISSHKVLHHDGARKLFIIEKMRFDSWRCVMLLWFVLILLFDFSVNFAQFSIFMSLNHFTLYTFQIF